MFLNAWKTEVDGYQAPTSLFCLPETKQECSPPEVSVYRLITLVMRQGSPPALLFRGSSQDNPDIAFNQPSCDSTCFHGHLQTEGIALGLEGCELGQLCGSANQLDNLARPRGSFSPRKIKSPPNA